MDAELKTLLESLQRNFKSKAPQKTVNDKDIFWTPVELVKTSFPERKSSNSRWLKEFGYYSLNLQQLEVDRHVPYGILAREIFDYLFNKFVVNVNQQKENPNRFYFASISDFINLVKKKPTGNKVSLDQRVSALEMLLNLESCAIRFKQKINEDESISNNNFFIREYRGPSHAKIPQKPSKVTGGQIEIELDYETFKKLASSKRVPTKSYLVDLADSSVTARDLIIFIASQCYSLFKRKKDFIDYSYSDLNQLLGKSEKVTIKEFNKDLKRAIKKLDNNYKKLFPLDDFPAELVSFRRGDVQLRIYRPKSSQNILCI